MSSLISKPMLIIVVLIDDSLHKSTRTMQDDISFMTDSLLAVAHSGVDNASGQSSRLQLRTDRFRITCRSCRINHCSSSRNRATMLAAVAVINLQIIPRSSQSLPIGFVCTGQQASFAADDHHHHRHDHLCSFKKNRNQA